MSRSNVEPTLGAQVERAGQALLALGEVRGPEMPGSLARLLEVVAVEAARTPRFAAALERALTVTDPANRVPAAPRRTGRRDPGVLDPFALYANGGEDGLRTRLEALDLEQLRDIIAEHGMDHDRLAMKWKDQARVVERIVERVGTRSAKGSAFR